MQLLDQRSEIVGEQSGPQRVIDRPVSLNEDVETEERPVSSNQNEDDWNCRDAAKDGRHGKVSDWIPGHR
jgi:hypothetical protein